MFLWRQLMTVLNSQHERRGACWWPCKHHLARACLQSTKIILNITNNMVQSYVGIRTTNQEIPFIFLPSQKHVGFGNVRWIVHELHSWCLAEAQSIIIVTVNHWGSDDRCHMMCKRLKSYVVKGGIIDSSTVTDKLCHHVWGRQPQ